MTTVWAPRLVRHRLRDGAPPIDVGRASSFGQVLEAFPPELHPFDLDGQRRWLAAEVRPFASGDDLVLLVGPTVMASHLLAWWTATFGAARLLLWDRPDKRYTIRRMEHPGRPDAH